ncbi:class I SAM-dependent methyltransferase [Pediococcus argentinicus]|uniref:class I SAM-dependent methyltransferase n=1 Tax=Pediococcus argentinicus TaxID=480391 RepID=UPI00338D4D0E
MDTNKIEQLFNVMDKSTDLLQKDLDVDYLDAVIETGDNLVSDEVQIEDGKPSKETVIELEKLYESIDISDFSAEEIRQALQLILIKANKKERIQTNHQFTPDAIGILFTYLIEALPIEEPKTVFDPAVGTGNLLATVLNSLKKSGVPLVSGIGVDNDDTMLSIASMAFALQHLDVDLYHQDVLDELFVGKPDVAISDLPVGYYPIDERVKDYHTSNPKEHSFVHHLMIEQTMATIDDGKFGIFLVPENLFQTEEAKKLLSYFHDRVYFQAVLNLPVKMFADKRARKSIIILQKVGGNAKQAEQVLLGDFPEFNDKEKMANFLGDFKAWSDQNIK